MLCRAFQGPIINSSGRADWPSLLLGFKPTGAPWDCTTQSPEPKNFKLSHRSWTCAGNGITFCCYVRRIRLIGRTCQRRNVTSTTSIYLTEETTLLQVRVLLPIWESLLKQMLQNIHWVTKYFYIHWIKKLIIAVKEAEEAVLILYLIIRTILFCKTSQSKQFIWSVTSLLNFFTLVYLSIGTFYGAAM